MVKNLIRYNLIITVLQLLILAVLLFAAFFMKFKMDGQRAVRNADQDFAIEEMNCNLTFSNNG